MIRNLRLLTILFAVAVATATIGLPSSVGAPADNYPEVAAWGKSANVIFGRVGGLGGIYTISPSGGKPRLLTAKAGGDGGLAVSPDGQTVLVGASGKILSIKTSGGPAHELVPLGFNPAWSPDGTLIAYTGAAGPSVMRADGGGSHRIVVSRYGDVGGGPAWSPDGKRLAYIACSDPYGSQPCEHQYGFDVYTIGINGKGKAKVTPEQGLPQCPAWSSRGVLAYLTSDEDLAIVQKSGTVKTYRPGGCPVWAPSGRRLALATAKGLFLMNSDGSGRKKITILPTSQAGFDAPAWSGDGTSLVVIGGDPSVHMWVVHADGSGLKKLL